MNHTQETRQKYLEIDLYVNFLLFFSFNEEETKLDHSHLSRVCRQEEKVA